MANVTVKHAKKTGAAANPAVLVDGPTWDNDVHVVTGLENVDNTSDINKPVSTAQAAADTSVASAAATALAAEAVLARNANNLSGGTVPLGRLPTLREVLTGARTYFVRSDGSDSNTGLVDSSGGGFLTIGKALTVAAGLDCASFQLTITVDAATWTVPISLPKVLGSLTPILTGVGSTTILSTSTASTYSIVNDGAGTWQVNNMKITNSGANGGCMVAKNGGVIKTQGVEFGACNDIQMWAGSISSIQTTGNYTISGGASTAHMLSNGTLVVLTSSTITITGTPAFGAFFAAATNDGFIDARALTFSGSATGTRYLAVNNGVINTNGGGATYFPGNGAGSVSTGGVYA